MKSKICGLEFIRTFAFILIFLNHTFSWIANHKVFDYGGRGVEIFFVMSGFLTAYNHYDKSKKEIQIKDCLNLVRKKLGKVYLLHIITFLLAAILVFRDLYLHYDKFAVLKTFISATLNVLLLQSWFNFSAWGFNGVSWFLSSIMFCYFVTPYLLKICKNIDRNFSDNTGILLSLFTLLAIKLVCDTIGHSFHLGWLGFAMYVSPVYRVLDYIVGLLDGILFLGFSSINEGKIVAATKISGLQIVVLMLYLVAIFWGDGKWIAGEFVFLTTMLIFVMSINTPFTQKLSNRVVVFLASISFEGYLLHNIFAMYGGKIFWWLCKNMNIMNTNGNKFVLWIVILMLTLSSSYLAHKRLPRI